jgi:hypothetical protein
MRRGWVALGYESWRECVAAEFGQSQAYLYRQLAAAMIERELLDFSPMGEKLDDRLCDRIPERQLRPLAALPTKEARQEAYAEATEAAKGKPTARHVEEAVAKKLTAVDGKHADDPKDVATLRKAGKIPADAVVTVSEPTREPGDDDDAEPVEVRVETDQDFLGKLKLRAKLPDRQRRIFEADALTFRELEQYRRAFQFHATRTLNKKGRKGAYAFRLSRFLKIDHPSDWVLCPTVEQGGCGGSGEVHLIGECPKCKGRGYWINS